MMRKLVLTILLFSLNILINGQTKIIAHRGFSSVAPENTLVAFKKAIDCGADYFELDVRKTIDDSLVVIHDKNLSRTCSNSAEGNIAEMTYQELMKARFGYSSKFGNEFSDEKIPTLRESLLLAKGKIKVCVEIKSFGIEEDVLSVINETGMVDEVIIFSFEYPVLTKIRMLNAEINTLLLISQIDDYTIDYAKVINVTAIGVGNKTVPSKELITKVHENGIELWQWTVNNEAKMEELLKLGFDGLITDYPDIALKVINANIGK